MKMVHLGLNYSRLLLIQPKRKKKLRFKRGGSHEFNSIGCRDGR
jgi:hypothetical protein